MCIALPGQSVDMGPEPHLATVEVSSVRRKVNIDLLRGETLSVGDWVLIQLGFAMSRISGDEAVEQLRLLRMLGGDAEAMRELDGHLPRTS